MNKKKILKGQGNFKKTTVFDPDKNLKKLKPKAFLKTLMFCIENDDYESFKNVLNSYLEVNNKSAVATDVGISRRALYHMTSDKANPTIKNIIRLYQSIKKAS